MSGSANSAADLPAYAACPRAVAKPGRVPLCDLCRRDARVTRLLCRPCLDMVRRVAEAETNIVRELEQEWKWAQAVRDQEHMHDIEDQLRAHGVALK